MRKTYGHPSFQSLRVEHRGLEDDPYRKVWILWKKDEEISYDQQNLFIRIGGNQIYLNAPPLLMQTGLN
jgi:hypothetical protein